MSHNRRAWHHLRRTRSHRVAVTSGVPATEVTLGVLELTGIPVIAGAGAGGGLVATGDGL